MWLVSRYCKQVHQERGPAAVRDIESLTVVVKPGRHSFYDRARYYLNDPRVQAAQDRLLENLSRTPIPLPLLSQYLPRQYERVRAGALSNDPRELLYDHIGDCIDAYQEATGVKLP